MHVNNEVGIIPIKEVGAIAKERGILFMWTLHKAMVNYPSCK